jgi:uncharacterized glyoxalase superfamily protein PhnB
MAQTTKQASRPTPAGWPRISSAVFYDDAATAIDWLVRSFGFEVRLKVEGEGGRIEHSELTFGDGLIQVGSTGRETKAHMRSPRDLDGGNTQSLCVIVDDVEAHFAHSKAAGAKIVSPPKTTDYGEEYWADRTYEVIDLEGHHWWFMQRMRNPGEPRLTSPDVEHHTADPAKVSGAGK